METPKSDVYEPDNLSRYYTALSFVDHLKKEGIIGAEDQRVIYTMIAEKYGLSLDSIFTVFA